MWLREMRERGVAALLSEVRLLLSEYASRSWQTPRKAWGFVAVVTGVSMLIPGLHSRAAEMESRNLDLGDQAK